MAIEMYCSSHFPSSAREKLTILMIMVSINATKDLSSRPELFCRKGVLRNFTKFVGNYLCQLNYIYNTV